MNIKQLKGPRLRSLLLGSAMVAGLGGLALAQAPNAAPTTPAATSGTAVSPPGAPTQAPPGAPTQAPPARSASVDPATLPETGGKVAQYDLTGRGDVNGLILADGTEVLFPPYLGTAVQAAVHPGDDVTIRGARNGTVVTAASIAGPSGAPIVDRGPAAARADQPSMAASGAVKMALHGPAGEVNGALLEDGTIIRLPPGEAAQRQDALQPGRTVAVRGDGVQGPTGRVIAARAFGPSPDKLTELAMPPPRPPMPPGPPGPLAPPPPPRG